MPQQKPNQNKNGHNGNGQRRDPGPAPQHFSRAQAKAWDRERTKINADLEAAKKSAADKDRKLRQKTRELEDLKLETQLGKLATRAGIKEVDFAINLIKQHVDSLPEDEIEKFAEPEIEKFFGGLRDTRPYLFGEAVKPATTGTGNGAAAGAGGNGAAAQPPVPPKPKDVTEQGKVEQIDARKMSTEEFRAHLRKKGINPAGV